MRLFTSNLINPRKYHRHDLKTMLTLTNSFMANTTKIYFKILSTEIEDRTFRQHKEQKVAGVCPGRRVKMLSRSTKCQTPVF